MSNATSAPQAKRARVEHKTQREWLLERPDTFIGPTSVVAIRIPIFTESVPGKVSSLTCSWTTVDASPAFLTLMNELVTNALDAGFRADADHPQKRIAIEWREEGVLSIKNDGPTLAIAWNAEHEWYDPQAAFGVFQSGTNFDDSEKRFTAGRNGVGAKGANTYASKMYLRIDNANDGKLYEQTWTDNMANVSAPRIVKSTRKTHETLIEWTPDFARLGGADTIGASASSIVRYLAYNASLCAVTNAKVFLGKAAISARTPEHFCRALGGVAPFAVDSVTDSSGRVVLQVCIAARSPDAESASTSLTMGFVNSTPCPEGTHAKLILHKVAECINHKLSKEAHVTAAFVKSNAIAVAVFAVVNPRFTSQTKECLDTPVRDFGDWKWTPSASFCASLERSPLVERARELARARDDATAAKATRAAPSTRAPRFEKYDAALKLHHAKSTLIVTEGDSAKNFAISGISEVGREFFGVYPVRGKFLNVRGLSPKAISENKEAHELLRILGLQLGATYDAKSAAKLPYARLMLMTDMDPDGSHIAALLINFLEIVAPSLLRLRPDYVCRFATSLVRVTLPRPEAPVGFYSQAEFDAWRRARREAGLGIGIAKYFKGLGTSSSALAKQYFKDLDRNTITLCHDLAPSAEALDLFFNKKRVEDRKTFLSSEECSPSAHLDYAESRTTIDAFVRRELLPQHGLSSIRRAIPSVFDGFNEAKRKVLYGARLVGMTERQLKAQGHGASIKVSEAAGKISAATHYHHADTSLCDTIVGMACNYAGASNLNLLHPEGQFGTRHNRTASASRYIETRLNDPLQYLLFPRADDAVLRHVEEDGRPAEPVHFVPVLPTALVFGMEGIATGWSTRCPPFHPLELIAASREWMEMEGATEAASHHLTPLVPWWRGFKGTIVRADEDAPNNFLVQGVFERRGEHEVHITELPPFKETDAILQGWQKHGIDFPLKGRGHTDDNVHLILNSGDIPKTDEELVKRLGLCKTVSFGNVHMLDEQGKLRKYDDPREVVCAHGRARLALYEARRAHEIARGEEQAKLAADRARYIRMCLDGSFDIRQYVDEGAASRALEGLGFAPAKREKEEKEGKEEKEEKEGDEGNEGDEGEGAATHAHLTRLPQSSLTRKRAAQIERASVDALARVETLRSQTAKSMWARELEALEVYLRQEGFGERM